MIWVTSFLKQGPYRNTFNLQSWTWPVIGIMVDYCFCSCPWIWVGSPTALTKRMWERWCSWTSETSLKKLSRPLPNHLFALHILTSAGFCKLYSHSCFPAGHILAHPGLPRASDGSLLLCTLATPHLLWVCRTSVLPSLEPVCWSFSTLLHWFVYISPVTYVMFCVCCRDFARSSSENGEYEPWPLIILFLSPLCLQCLARARYPRQGRCVALPVAKCGLGVRLPSVRPAPAPISFVLLSRIPASLFLDFITCKMRMVTVSAL